MIESGDDEKTGEKTIILKPNGSMTGRQSFMFLLLCGLAMGAVGGGFALAGAWMVLPFSGLEWLVLAYCIHLSRKDAAAVEVIFVSEDLVRVEKTHARSFQAYEFRRAWVMIECMESPIRGHASRLALRLHGREIEIGRFLVETERRALARELKALLSSS